MADCESGEVSNILKKSCLHNMNPDKIQSTGSTCPRQTKPVGYRKEATGDDLYLYNVNSGVLKNQITSGNYLVREGLKTKCRKTCHNYLREPSPGTAIHILATCIGWNSMVEKSKIADSCRRRSHCRDISPGGNTLLIPYSQADVPPVHEVRDIKGKPIASLEKTDISRLEASGWKPPMPFTVRSANDRGNRISMALCFLPQH